jgi:hypothetical protein
MAMMIVHAIARVAEEARPRPALMKTQVSIPPNITNSPVAKFITPLMRNTVLQHIPTMA